MKGYPTVKAFVNGRDAGDYKGDRTAAAAKAWALALVPNHVITLNRKPQVPPSPDGSDPSGSRLTFLVVSERGPRSALVHSSACCSHHRLDPTLTTAELGRGGVSG